MHDKKSEETGRFQDFWPKQLETKFPVTEGDHWNDRFGEDQELNFRTCKV